LLDAGRSIGTSPTIAIIAECRDLADVCADERRTDDHLAVLVEHEARSASIALRRLSPHMGFMRAWPHSGHALEPPNAAAA
jgi:hypothetical protein